MNYKAPWSKAVIITSVATTLIVLLILPLTCWTLLLVKTPRWVEWVGMSPLLILLGAAPFTIRGYTLLPDAILIKRLFWSTRVSLDGLRSATFEPDGMKGSIRIGGNGGLYSVTGWYWSRKLGRYRAFVMDHKNVVVLKFENRTLLLSPAPPEQFVAEILKNRGL